MEAQAQVKIPERGTNAVEVLRRLNDLGAINLDVMVSKAAEIRAITSGGSASSAADDLNPEDKICYRFYIRVGPPKEIDIVSVANELRSLGFEVKRIPSQKG